MPSSVLTNDTGQSLRLTRLALLISNVALLRADGSVVRLDGQFGFLDAATGRWAATLRSVPAGEYSGMEFSVGVPPSVNHADPARWPAGHALHPLVNGLHWSWQGGYVFAALEGRWRDGNDERGFSYHLATDARLMRVRFLAHFNVAGDTAIELALDVARVLAAQRIAADDGTDSTHSGAGDALAPELAAAFERAWFWLGAVPAPRSSAPPSEVAGRVSGGTAEPYAFTIPVGFPQPELPADNPLTLAGVALGKALFFDRRLSGNGTQSCASCHEPARAFSDSVALSAGATGARGARNAMPLFNLAWNPSFAWDGGKPRIRDQARAAWTSPIEMNAHPAAVIAALVPDKLLAEKFAAAFGAREITAERIALALEQYLLTLVAADSKFDRALAGKAQLSDDEKRGFELFLTEFDPVRGRRGADCFHCHGGPLFSDFAFKDTGLDLNSVDAGRALLTSAASDRGKFKTPSLRNVALTAPYMHDGRFATLEDVVAHYDRGVKRSANLDPNLAKHPAAGLELSADDRRALVAFLLTLTDSAFEPARAQDASSSQ